MNRKTSDATNTPVYADLKGKSAVVTGGSRGIGAATARLLARNGAKVVVNGRDQSAIDSVVRYIQSNEGIAIGFAADCTDSDALAKMREKTESEFGAVEILIAFAGGLGNPQSTTKIEEKGWNEIINLNLTAKFLTVKAFLPAMIERRKGAIVIMSSSAGRLPSQANAAYACAEAGANMLAKHVANEVGKHNIRVNCVAPSAIHNERMEKFMSQEQMEQMKQMFPLGRIGEPEDVAQATVFLVSESASWITGATLDISGGRIIL